MKSNSALVTNALFQETHFYADEICTFKFILIFTVIILIFIIISEHVKCKSPWLEEVVWCRYTQTHI